MWMQGEFHGSGMLVLLIFVIVPIWKIVSKAGYSGAWSLLSVVPVVNLVALWIFAWSRWPLEQNRGGNASD
jgi:lipopolysaccharide export LptBFGC system permease protein LptF